MNEGQNCNVTSKLAESQRNEFYDNVLTFIEFGRASIGGFEQSKSNPVCEEMILNVACVLGMVTIPSLSHTRHRRKMFFCS